MGALVLDENVSPPFGRETKFLRVALQYDVSAETSVRACMGSAETMYNYRLLLVTDVFVAYRYI